MPTGDPYYGIEETPYLRHVRLRKLANNTLVLIRELRPIYLIYYDECHEKLIRHYLYFKTQISIHLPDDAYVSILDEFKGQSVDHQWNNLYKVRMLINKILLCSWRQPDEKPLDEMWDEIYALCAK